MSLTTIRQKPTDSERSFLNNHPQYAFGFFLKTDRPAADEVPAQWATVTEPAFKLFDGYGIHVVATASGLRAVLNHLLEQGLPVRQHLLLRNGDDCVPAYGGFVAGTPSRPIPTASLSVPR